MVCRHLIRLVSCVVCVRVCEGGKRIFGGSNRSGEWVIDVKENQSGSQNRSLRDSGIDFEKVGQCAVNHCMDLAVIEERFGPD